MRVLILNILILLLGTSAIAAQKKTFTCNLRVGEQVERHTVDITNSTGIVTTGTFKDEYSLDSSADENGIFIIILRNRETGATSQARAWGPGRHNAIEVESFMNGIALAQAWCTIEEN
jgi:hypothetical protein